MRPEASWGDVESRALRKVRRALSAAVLRRPSPVRDEREVIVFDNTGVGFSSGSVPPTVTETADGALEFIDALGLSNSDLLGWSMGGFVAQAVALTRPTLVRRLIVAGSNAGKVPDAPASPAKVWEVAPKPINDDEVFL
jgi:pimeloyl-ACP methyl ester carboxylesterase